MARILICDDSSYVRLQIKQFVKKIGHAVAGEVADGRDAVAMYAALKPDLVIIMLTSDANRENIVQAIKNGAKDFLVKPFHQKSFLFKLHQLLGRRPLPAAAADADSGA